MMLVIREFEESLEPLTCRGKIPGSVPPGVRPGGRRGRRDPRARADRHRREPAPPSPPRARQGHDAHVGHGRALGPGDRLRRRSRRQMHLIDFSLGYFGSNGIVGPSLGYRHGRGPRRQAAGRRARSASASSATAARTRAEPGSSINFAALSEAAADRDLREQPVRRRDLHPAGDGRGRRSRSARPASGCPRSGRRAGRRAPSTAPTREARERAATATARRSSRPSPTATTATTPARQPDYRDRDRGRGLAQHARPDRAALRRRSIGGGALTTGRMRRRRSGPRKIVADAIAFAEELPAPDPETATTASTGLPYDRKRSPAMSEPLTVGQAFQQGLPEEMARDDSIFVIGTDLFIRGGHFAQVKGSGRDVRPRAGHRRTDLRSGDGRGRRGRGDERDASDHRPELHRLRLRRDGRDRESGGEGPLPVGRAGADGYPRLLGGLAFARAAQQQPRVLVHAHARAWSSRCRRTPATPRACSSLRCAATTLCIFLMHKRLTGARGEVGGADDCTPIGQGQRAARGRRRHAVTYGGHRRHKLLKAADALLAERASRPT